MTYQVTYVVAFLRFATAIGHVLVSGEARSHVRNLSSTVKQLHQERWTDDDISCCVAEAKSPINAECEESEGKIIRGLDKEIESMRIQVRKRLTDTCEAKWVSLVECSLRQQHAGFYYPGYIRDKFMNRTGGFPYVPNVANKARVLVLGDSVSRGTWEEAMKLASSSQKFVIYGAPTNCGGFSAYTANLDMWLGSRDMPVGPDPVQRRSSLSVKKLDTIRRELDTSRKTSEESFSEGGNSFCANNSESV